MEFGTKKAGTAAKERPARPDGKAFIAEVKEALHELCAGYVRQQDDYADVEELTKALEADVWTLFEQQLKQSFRNGIATAKAKQHTANS